MGDRHITETQITIDLVGIGLGRMLRVSFMISLDMYALFLPPYIFLHF